MYGSTKHGVVHGRYTAHRGKRDSLHLPVSSSEREGPEPNFGNNNAERTLSSARDIGSVMPTTRHGAVGTAW